VDTTHTRLKAATLKVRIRGRGSWVCGPPPPARACQNGFFTIRKGSTKCASGSLQSVGYLALCFPTIYCLQGVPSGLSGPHSYRYVLPMHSAELAQATAWWLFSLPFQAGQAADKEQRQLARRLVHLPPHCDVCFCGPHGCQSSPHFWRGVVVNAHHTQPIWCSDNCSASLLTSDACLRHD
jgi:hypothetical protein